MNVYSCFHHGNFGYGCRTGARTWMFVPELGQPDDHIYKNLSMDDLIFRNPFDRKIELNRENQLRRFSLKKIIRWVFSPVYKPQTVCGLLFTQV